jgi:hypothetical protein
MEIDVNLYFRSRYFSLSLDCNGNRPCSTIEHFGVGMNSLVVLNVFLMLLCQAMPVAARDRILFEQEDAWSTSAKVAPISFLHIT